MPTWSEILTELKVESAQGNSAPFDFIRRKYLSELSKYTIQTEILFCTQLLLPKKVELPNYFR